MPPPANLSGLSRAELEARFVELLGDVSELKQMVAAQRDEIARLKGLKGRPSIKPSGMENATEPKAGGKRAKRRGRGKVTPRVTPETEELRVSVPQGSKFKGYALYHVQDLVLSARVVCYRRERWLTPEGKRVLAPLPDGIQSRLNFLDLLRAGHTDYVINDAALGYMRDHALAGPLLQQLAVHEQRRFADETAWMRHLEQLGMTSLAVTPDPVRVATEGALWGAVGAHGFLCEAVVVSDDAGQFDVGRHALCWIHAERLVHKLETFPDRQRAAQQHVRGLIWWFYADLKAYRLDPTPRRRREMRARFDRIFQRHTGFTTLDRLLKRLHANKTELLMVLDHPEIPLHTNGSENDIRCQVTKRQISGGTHSDIGRDCRDAFLGLAKTCRKLGIGFWDYLGARLGVLGDAAVPRLPDIIRGRSRTQPA
jgi:hypothetical protein